MLYLVITILLNVVISVIFKLFSRYKINILQAIVTNYCVCVVTGYVFGGQLPFTTTVLNANWLPWALIMGVAFISIFNLMAWCTRVDGITTTAVANKLSLVIPVMFSVVLYHDTVGWGKLIGILLALPAVYFTTRVNNGSIKHQNLFLPILLFTSSGLLDTSVKYVQFHYLPSPMVQAAYTTCCLAVAAIIGIVLVTALFVTKKMVFHWRNVVAGICLGIPNFFSIYFLIRMLDAGSLQSSASLPILNVGIVVVSAIAAIIAFGENGGRQRLIGLFLSVIAILLIAFGDR